MKVELRSVKKNLRNQADEKKSFDTVKKKIIDLVAAFLFNKFSKLFKYHNYPEKKLKNDLSQILTEAELRNFKMEETVEKMEKNILERLKKEDELDNKNGNSEKVEKNEKVQKFDENNFYISENNNITKIPHLQVSPSNSKLIDKLHQKENEEWSQIVKNNYNKFLQDQKEKIIKDNLKKKSTKEFYEMQIYQKEYQKKMEQSELENFLKIRDDNLKKIDDKEKKVLQVAIEKVKSQKEIKTKMLNDFYANKKTQKIKDELEQKNYLDYIIIKKKEEEEKKLRKKEIVKDLYKNVYEQIESKQEKKKLEKEKEKFESLKKNDEYSKILQQRDNERNKTIYKMLNKFEKKCEREQSPDFKFIDREEIKNIIGEERYREQSIEREIRIKIEEENRKKEKIKNKEEMKSFLESQIKEKNNRKFQLINEDENYVNHVISSFDKFKNEERLKELKKKEEMIKYKKELDMQYKEKNSSKGNIIF